MGEIKDSPVVYILAKNEALNIGRSLQALARLNLRVTVLDSGSTDSTISICSGFPFCEVTPFEYNNHCDAYNHITSSAENGYVIILDADMRITDELFQSIRSVVHSGNSTFTAYLGKVEMWVEGGQTRRCSLYPPKPILFRTGRKYFTRLGHGEALLPDVCKSTLNGYLIHDDRKNYDSYLGSQFRYSSNLINRAKSGEISFRDAIRLSSILMVIISPLYSFVFKLGFLDGRRGLIYALDRLIAEAIMYRQSLAMRVRQKDSAKD